MVINQFLNEDISLEIAEYLELEDLISMSKASSRYGRFWTNAVKAIPRTHYPRLVPLSEPGPEEIRKAAIRTANSRRAWCSAEEVRPRAVFRLHEKLEATHFVRGTKWMLALPARWSEKIPPSHWIVSVKCYDITTGLLAGSFNMAVHTIDRAYAPSWHTSVAVSATEIIVGLERWSQSVEYYLQRIRLSHSSETDEIIFTAEPILQVTEGYCDVGISHDGKFFALHRGDDTIIYRTDGATGQVEFCTDTSDNEKYISFHGDTLVVMEERTLNIVGLHLPSLLKDWPERHEYIFLTITGCSIGASEGDHTLVRRGLDLGSSFETAILDSVDHFKERVTDASHLDVAYMKDDRCFVLPVRIGAPDLDADTDDWEPLVALGGSRGG
ncbi:hypothetical protein PIIN_05240 [Serendipita indica DSM 11827]|uniref:F-box domain-containing protein n=1 Tax=Serendipita indica (strain DSM 11827) TaxID=1109443 RepID=G4TJ08_SERID|nr:hypothetical protein PIIN_05240 [Serendipita indica DSM 11827]